jgi:CubicO group peptidase (beta-lactamase class C family)
MISQVKARLSILITRKTYALATAVLVLLAALTVAAPPKLPKLPGIVEKMQESIDSGEIAGAVTLVATKDKILHLSADGQADSAAHKPMQVDSIFWIASMTKPITATAVLIMQDEGKLNLDDPVGKYIPEFKNLKTVDGKSHTVTIRHILTHTSGMGEATAEESGTARTLADLIAAYARKPLKFEPGSKWAYCQSGINTAARIVEIVSGQPFHEFLEKRLFGPLNMKDTTFYLSEAQLVRLAKSYKKNKEGKLEETAIFILQGRIPTDRNRYPAANGGLFSTALDYARFCQMILNGGTLDGKRYLKPESVKLMTTVSTGDLPTGFTPGNGWGLGWCLVREPQGVTAMLSPGTHGHGGAYGTQAWIDPAKDRIFILMCQRANFPNSDASDVRKAFQQAAVVATGPATEGRYREVTVPI